ncbi:Protein phosphatase protein [Lasiodiplodia theobromae]|uniref:Protein phosphatase protein n=1 Tax=Lasiodiplodia theobromae TaxID=45133 RepID=UPI0015C39B79|nr:Protein phosphatase protein [Lasiodiplodia theobromae]KAF4535948.1 Protein phosphatase protein [Lasiodiplodia theobromae]
MDSRIRVSKVDNVACWRVGRGIDGTLHLQLHHLVFRYPGPGQPADGSAATPAQRPKEIPPAIRVQCRDFTFFSLHFRKESDARDVYDTIRSPEPERAIGGWKIYDPRQEFKRLGISAKDTDKGWRITDINHDYQARGI